MTHLENPNKAVKTYADGANLYTLSLYGEITNHVSDYAEHLAAFREADEDDDIVIFISSGGGSVFTTLEYLHAMEASNATITAHVGSICHSAATFIFLAADYRVVCENTLVMFHNYATYTGGSGNEGIEHAEAIRHLCHNVMDKYYTDFLTKEEISAIKTDNKTFWLSGNEVIKRSNELEELTKMEYEDAQFSEARESIIEQLKNPKVVEILKGQGFNKDEGSEFTGP